MNQKQRTKAYGAPRTLCLYFLCAKMAPEFNLTRSFK
nr:MAG TPA: hypothetical protein [Caudoviricetes sp.]